MRILIDGYIFAHQELAETAEWWRQVIPRVVSLMTEGDFFFLNRTAAQACPAQDRLHHLFAPPADYAPSALEDRRLAALCRLLDVDIFISTYHTSAGASIRSLYVDPATTAGPAVAPQREASAVESSQDRALRLAAGYWTLTTSIPAEWKIAGVCEGSDRIWTSTASEAPTWSDIAARLVVALRDLGQCQLSARSTTRRLKEEEQIQAEADRLKQVALEQTTAAHTAHAQRLQTEAKKGRYRRFLARTFRALLQPAHYPQYALEFYSRLRQKAGRYGYR